MAFLLLFRSSSAALPLLMMPSATTTANPKHHFAAKESDHSSWIVQPSDCATRTTNPLRNIVDRLQLPSVIPPDKPLISLALGDPTVYLQPPKELLDAAHHVLSSDYKGRMSSCGYPPAIGYEDARQAIAERATKAFYDSPRPSYSSEDVVITSGCSGALEMAISALCSEGSTIMIPCPGFSLYRTIAESKGLVVMAYPLKPESNWEVDLEACTMIMEEQPVAAWIINNPSNPCGSVYSEKHLVECLRLAKKQCVTVIADEIYEDMTFAGQRYHPMASISTKHTIGVSILTCSGLAKRFLVPGWRVGWILVHDTSGAMQKIRKALVDLSGLLLGANSVAQAAMPLIFERVPESFFAEVNAYLEHNARFAETELVRMPGLHAIRPQGTLYMMVCPLHAHSFFVFLRRSELICSALRCSKTMSTFARRCSRKNSCPVCQGVSLGCRSTSASCLQHRQNRSAGLWNDLLHSPRDTLACFSIDKIVAVFPATLTGLGSPFLLWRQPCLHPSRL